MPDCEYFESLLSHRLDEPLPENDAAALDRHLRECRSCRDYAESIRRDRDLLRSLPREPLDGQLPVPARPNVIVRLCRARISLPLPAAAVLLAALLGLGALLNSGSASPPTEPSAVVQRLVQIDTLQPVSATPVNP